MENKDKAWSEYFGKGWEVYSVPSRRESFEAGYEAALKLINEDVEANYGKSLTEFLTQKTKGKI